MKQIIIYAILFISIPSFASEFTVSSIESLSKVIETRVSTDINYCDSIELSVNALNAYTVLEVESNDLSLNAEYKDISNYTALSVAETYARANFSCLPVMIRGVVRNMVLDFMKEQYLLKGNSDWGHSKKIKEIY